ncbi:hypothetical protein AXG93_242s1320 [Marchantia polymorpha subsp. ruderalis]|uniref:BHLH domain-containing protein n=1 Tax=Marchantia polymorpha subsp. ruderalis TaxID=1480154 RepID=A0A176VLW8_MARPO|nr:hypothetical protein AXG93_242s1320 [Marchantia polymorpha subsp. ruderalis]
MFEDLDLGTACKNFQNLAADLVERWQSQKPCTESGRFNYIMFDQSGGKGRIFQHPSRLLHEFPTSSSSPPQPNSPDLYQDMSLQEFEDTLLRNSVQDKCDPRMAACRETVASAYAAVQQQQQDKNDDQIRHQNPTALFPEEVYSAFQASEEESSRAAGGGYLYEDADDLEALLGCSDEEESITGNAPSSELTCHFGLQEDDNIRPCEPSSRKRPCVLDEEVDSKFKRQRSQEEEEEEVEDICIGTCSSSVSVVDAFSGDSLGPPCALESEADDCLDESALELQMLCDDFGYEMPEEQQCSSCSKEDGDEGDSISSGSARKSRRDKIKKTVKLLRNIIPGGDCMDTAIVLDEAIHYVKLLQLQCEHSRRRMG